MRRSVTSAILTKCAQESVTRQLFRGLSPQGRLEKMKEEFPDVAANIPDREPLPERRSFLDNLRGGFTSVRDQYRAQQADRLERANSERGAIEMGNASPEDSFYQRHRGKILGAGAGVAGAGLLAGAIALARRRRRREEGRA